MEQYHPYQQHSQIQHHTHVEDPYSPMVLDVKGLQDREYEQEMNEYNANLCLDEMLQDLEPLENWCHKILDEFIPQMKNVHHQMKELIERDFDQVKATFNGYRNEFQRAIKLHEEITRFQQSTFFHPTSSHESTQLDDRIPHTSTYPRDRSMNADDEIAHANISDEEKAAEKV